MNEESSEWQFIKNLEATGATSTLKFPLSVSTISNTSVASFSKKLQLMKHDTYICLEDCEASLERSLNALNITQSMEDKVESVCTSCTDLSPSVAECLTCEDYTSLCQPCLAAHRRVKLTKEHDIKIEMTSQALEDTPELSLLRSFKFMMELTNMSRRHKCLDLESALDACISKALELKIQQDVEMREEVDRALQELIDVELLPFISEKSLDISFKVVKILNTMFEIGIFIRDPASLMTESCLEAYIILLSSLPENTDRIILTLDCLLSMVTLLQTNLLKYLAMNLQEKLAPVLTRLKAESRCINIKFKAVKLIKQIEKACNMFSFDFY